MQHLVFLDRHTSEAQEHWCFPSLSLSPDILSTQSFFSSFWNTQNQSRKETHQSFRVCAAARGRHSLRISRDLYLSPKMVQHRLLHSRWSNISDLQFTQLFIIRLFHIVASIHNFSVLIHKNWPMQLKAWYKWYKCKATLCYMMQLKRIVRFSAYFPGFKGS